MRSGSDRCNLLRSDAEIEEIEPLLKSDPSVAFNLLRAINAWSMGLSCEITSMRHAVMIFGRQRLFRWASMLLAKSREGGAPTGTTTAMVRGRMMELIAAELLPPQECDNAFVTGVFSIRHRRKRASHHRGFRTQCADGAGLAPRLPSQA